MTSTIDLPERERRWQKIGDVFGLKVQVVDAEHLGLPSELGRLVVIRDLGAEKGMILFPIGSKILKYSGQIISSGYAYSVVDPTKLESESEMESCRVMLADWGYRGNV